MGKYILWPKGPYRFAIGVALAIQLLGGCNKSASTPAADTNRTEHGRSHQEDESSAHVSAEHTGSPNSKSSEEAARASAKGKGSSAQPTGNSAIGSQDALGDHVPGPDRDAKKQGPGTQATGQSTKRARGKTRAKNPNAAEKLGNDLLGKATKAANGGDMTQAFQAALQAWELTRDFVDAPECQAIAAKALKLTEKYGEAANRAVSKPGNRGPITVK